MTKRSIASTKEDNAREAKIIAMGIHKIDQRKEGGVGDTYADRKHKAQRCSKFWNSTARTYG